MEYYKNEKGEISVVREKCIGCGKCTEDGCIFTDDKVNEYIKKAKDFKPAIAEDLSKTLNYIVYILVISAVLLAFIVFARFIEVGRLYPLFLFQSPRRNLYAPILYMRGFKKGNFISVSL